MSQNSATQSATFERKWNPKLISEKDKTGLDNIIQEFWTRKPDMTFHHFFYKDYVLEEFTKEEIIYISINGDIPFQQIHFSNDDEDFAKARQEAGMENAMEKPNANERKWDPKGLSEACKMSLDEMIQSYWERHEWQTLDDFVHSNLNLQKEQYIYLV